MQWLQFSILFAAAIVVPVLIYLVTLNAMDWAKETIRVLSVMLGFTATILLPFIWSVKIFEREFNGNGAYLMQMLPVKVRDLLISKTLFFFLWTALSLLFALLFVCLVNMDFSAFKDLYDFFVRNWNELTYTSEYVLVFTIGFRILLSVITLYGFICATAAFGHLFGVKKSRYEALFVIAVIVISNIYNGINFRMQISFGPNNETIGFVSNFAPTLPSVMFYIDTAVAVGVTIGFFLFANWVFTKKINVL
jgi:hypothetical protein